MITTLHLSRLFYEQDPIGTCCRVNKGMEDEYDHEANLIIQQLRLGIPFKIAVHDIFSFSWWSGCIADNQLQIAIVEAQYYNHISKYKI